MKKFVGRFAKWRYETLYDALKSLLAMAGEFRQFLIQKVDSILKEFQDASLLKAVKEALSWSELWHFMSVFFTNIVSDLEMSRRWGLKCACRACQQMREEQKKQIACGLLDECEMQLNTRDLFTRSCLAVALLVSCHLMIVVEILICMLQ